MADGDISNNDEAMSLSGINTFYIENYGDIRRTMMRDLARTYSQNPNQDNLIMWVNMVTAILLEKDN